MTLLHPAFAYILAAVAMLVIPQRLRWIALIFPIAALAMLEGLQASGTVEVAGLVLEPVRNDALAMCFARIFSIMGIIGTVYGLQEENRAALAAAMIYVAGALIVALAGDLWTLFVGWEVKAIASGFVVLLGGRERSFRAGFRYLLIHTVGGGCLAIGISLVSVEAGSLSFDVMQLDASTAWILAGFALSAGVPPLHGWITESYPEGSPAGSVFLCAFTTKAAVYALLRGFPGTEMLIWVGVGMALYGAVFGILENDIRRLLAYSIISQIGYMVCAVGMGTDLSINGASAHAFCHILYKGLLFMATGAVIYATGRSKLSELGGLWRTMPWTFGFYMIGAVSISAVPPFNGFVSKSMIVSAAEHEHLGSVELLLTVASVGTWVHTGLKLPWFAFFGKDRGVRPSRPLPWNMMVGMGAGAALCIGIGVLPQVFYAILPNDEPYHPYTWHHLITGLQLLIGAAIVFVLLLKRLGGEPTETRDTHELFAATGRAGVGFARNVVVPTFEAAASARDRTVAGVVAWAADPHARRAPVGFWVLIAVAALAGLVLAMRQLG